MDKEEILKKSRAEQTDEGQEHAMRVGSNWAFFGTSVAAGVGVAVGSAAFVGAGASVGAVVAVGATSESGVFVVALSHPIKETNSKQSKVNFKNRFIIFSSPSGLISA